MKIHTTSRAALLEPPKFDPAASDAANYGAIGAILGHELSHLVDSLSAEYEADGRMRRWWTADDTARYDSATEALVQQYAAYQALPDLAVDGKRTLVENLADLGGLTAAFEAYRHTLGSKANDPDLVRQQNRQFFIGFARSMARQESRGRGAHAGRDRHACARAFSHRDRFATSMRGTTRSTCSQQSVCTWHRRRASGSGERDRVERTG